MPEHAPTASQATLDRIQAMRAKAENLLAADPNHPEGLAFQAQWLKQVARYQLDPDSLGAASHPAGDVTAMRYPIPGGPWAAKREALVSMVLGIFKVPHLLATDEDRKRAAIISGTETTLAAACEVCDHLLPQLDLMVIRAKADPTYLAETGAGRRLFVSGALDSWTVALAGRLAALYREAEAETPANAPGKDLAVVDKAEQMMQNIADAAMQMNPGARSRNLAAPAYHHEQARRIGRDAAARADIGQTATGPTGTAPLAVGA